MVLNIYLISEFGDLLQDIPGAFADPRIKIHLIGGAHSVFNKQENFLEIQKHPNKTFIKSLLLEVGLINSIDGLVIVGSDSEMREIAESDVNLGIKLKLLPIKNPEALKIFDSKVGLQEVMEKLKLQAPLGIVVNGPREFSDQKNQLQPPYLIKGDKGGGGIYVRRVSANSPYPKIDDIPFPFVLQEEISGPEISIDSYFVNGTLRAYIYSDQIKSMSKYGPSYMRRISRPANDDFLQTLKTFGEFVGVHGFVNATFIFDAKLNKHFLIEFDPRPNAWQFLAPILGIDLISIFTGSKSEMIETPNKVNFRIILLNRFIYYLSETGNPWKHLKALSALLDPDLLVISGKQLNRFEILGIFIFQSPRIVAFRILRKLFRLLPGSITNPIKRKGLTNRIARKIVGRL